MKKRILALVLTVAMLLSLFPGHVFATQTTVEHTEPVTGNTATEPQEQEIYTPVPVPEVTEPSEAPKPVITDPLEVPEPEITDPAPPKKNTGDLCDVTGYTEFKGTGKNETFILDNKNYCLKTHRSAICPLYSSGEARMCLQNYSIEFGDASKEEGRFEICADSTLHLCHGTVIYDPAGSCNAAPIRVFEYGNLMMSNITVNQPLEASLAVQIDAGGLANIKNSTIIGNEYGIQNSGTLTLSGSNDISGTNADILLGEGGLIAIGENFVAPTEDYVIETEQNLGVVGTIRITTGWSTSGLSEVPFTPSNPDYLIVLKDGELWLSLPPHVHDDGTVFVSLLSNDGITNVYDTLIKGGYYALTGDGEFSALYEYNENFPKEVHICLNGHTLYGEQWYIKDKLVILDCTGKGKISFTDEDIIQLDTAVADVTLKDITIEREPYSDTWSLFRIMTAGANLTIDGCTITDGSAKALSLLGNHGIDVTIRDSVLHNTGSAVALVLESHGYVLDGYNIIKADNNADICITHENGVATLLGLAPDFDPAPEGKEAQTYRVSLHSTALKALANGPLQITTGWSAAKKNNSIDYIPFSYYGEGYGVYELPTASGERELFICNPQVRTETDGRGTLEMISPDAADVRPDSVITLKATAGDGYTVGQVTANYVSLKGEIEPITLTAQRNDTNTYTFTMPNIGLVECYATFEHAHKHYMAVDTENGDGVEGEEKIPFVTALTQDSFPADGVLSEGSYVLMGLVEYNGTVTIEGNVKLCLFGNTLDLQDGHIILSQDAHLEICDCIGTGLITSGNLNQTEGIIYLPNGYSATLSMYGGTIQAQQANTFGVNVYGSNTMNLYDGKITCVFHAVYAENGTLNMFGGELETTGNEALRIIGGTATITGGQIYYRGTGSNLNAIYQNGGTLEINGEDVLIWANTGSALYVGIGQATITKGKLQSSGDHGVYLYGSGKVTVNPATVSDVEIRAQSSAIILWNYGTLDMQNGTLVSTNAGGHGIYNIKSKNVSVSGGTITARCYGINNGSGTVKISGGTITGGQAGVYNGGSGTITMTDGTVTATSGAGNGIHNFGTVTISGGTVTGKQYGVWHNGVALNMSAAPVVNGGADIYLASGKKINISGALNPPTIEGDEEEYSVIAADPVSEATPVQITTNWSANSGSTTTADNSFVITSANPAYSVRLKEDGELYLVIPHEHFMAVDCLNGTGTEGEERVLFTNDLYQSNFPAGDVLKEGAYVLRENITLNGSVTVTGKVDLCLNGYTLDLVNGKILVQGGTLSICDCNSSGSETGGVITSNLDGAVITVTGYAPAIGTSEEILAGTLNLYGGTIINTGTNGNNNDDIENAGIITSGTTTVYGGSVIGGDFGFINTGTATIYDGVIRANGIENTAAALYNNNSGIATVYGGDFYGYNGVYNANVVNSKPDSTLYIMGGTFYGHGTGGSNGGVVNNRGTMEITGGTITGAHYGVLNLSLGKMTISGTPVIGDQTVSKAAVYSTGTLDITDGTITLGTGNSGVALYVNGGTTTVSGGRVENPTGTAAQVKSNGILIVNKNAYISGKTGIYHSGSALKMSGSPVINGSQTDVSLNSGKTITIEGLLTPPTVDGKEEKYSVIAADPVTEATPVQITTDWTNNSGSTAIADNSFMITSANSAYIVRLMQDGELYLVVPHTHYMAVDTENGLVEEGVQKANWYDFSILLSSYADLVALDKDHNESNGIQLAPGNYVLTDSFTCDNMIEFAAEGTINLCLNGKVLTMNDRIYVGAPNDSPLNYDKYELHICDCSRDPDVEGDWGKGGITSGEGFHTNEQALGVFMLRVNNLSLYGGTLSATGKPVVYALRVNNNGEDSNLSLYGGQIRGDGASAVYSSFGSSIHAHIYDGLITTNQGNALDLDWGGTLHMFGGKVESTGTSYADHAIHIHTASLLVSGGEVSAIGGDGINLMADSNDIRITGGLIHSVNGNGLFNDNYGAPTHIAGGYIYSENACGVVTNEMTWLSIEGGTIQAKSAEDGEDYSGLYVYYESNVTITGGTILSNGGPGICNWGYVDIYGGEVHSDHGSGIVNWCDVYMYDGDIRSDNGYGIENYSYLYMSDGKVHSAEGVGIYNESDVTLSGGEVISLKDYGIYQNGRLNMSGDPVVNGMTVDIYLPAERVITIIDKLVPVAGETYCVETEVKPTVDAPVVRFTEDWEIYATDPEIFTQNNPAYTIGTVAEGEYLDVEASPELHIKGHVHVTKDGTKILYDVAFTQELIDTRGETLPLGNYLVVEDVESAKLIAFREAGDNHICLQGHTVNITYTGERPGLELRQGAGKALNLRIDDCAAVCGTIHANWFGFHNYALNESYTAGEIRLVNGNLNWLQTGNGGLLNYRIGGAIRGSIIVEGGSITGYNYGLYPYDPNYAAPKGSVITVCGGLIDANIDGLEIDSGRFIMYGSPVIYGKTTDINLYKNMIIEIPQALIPPVTEDGYTEAYSVLTYINPTAEKPVRFTRGWGENADLDYIPFYSPKGYLVREMDYTYTNEAGEAVTTKELYLVVPEITVPFYAIQGERAEATVDTLVERIIHAYNEPGMIFRDPTGYTVEGLTMVPVTQVQWPDEAPSEDLTPDELEDWYEDRMDENSKISFAEQKEGDTVTGYTWTANADGSYARTLKLTFRDEKFIAKKGDYDIDYTLNVKLNIKVFDVKENVYVLDYGMDTDLGKSLYLRDVLPGTLLGKEPVAEDKDPTTELWIDGYTSEEPTYHRADDGIGGFLQVKDYALAREQDEDTSKLLIKSDMGEFTAYKDGSGMIYSPTVIMEQGDTLHLVYRAMEKNLMDQLREQGGVPNVGEEVSPTMGIDFYKTVTILPANVVYYEDSFAGLDWYDGEEAVITVAEVGTSTNHPQDVTDSDEYGNNSDYTYAPDTYTGSGGTYKDIVIKGDGTVLSFTFTGTGFDLLGTTDAKSGMLEYIIHTLDEQGAEAELYRGVLDTEYLAGEIHEAPLLHKELPYGRYRVEINGWVEYDWDATEGWVYDEELGWALPPVIPAYLRLDGVRIYNALSYEDADREHYAEGEKEASFRQLRDMLLNGEAAAASFDNEGRFQLGSGLISYVETGREGMSYKGNAVSSMDAYLLAGPNNEVYFNSDTQSIVFYVKETEAEAHRLQIGIRNLNPKAFGSDGAPTAPGVVVLGVDEKGESPVNTVVDGEGRAIGYTEQYYTVDYTKCVKETIGTEEYYRVVISSNKNTPFCISNVKYAGLAFAEIPQKEQDLSYDAQGLPVGESKDMPNLHGLVWQLRRAYGMLPEDELEEPVDESLTMMAISLSLHSSIGMNIYVNDAVIGDYDEVYVSVEKLYADGVYETAKLDAYTPAQVSGMACRSYCYNDLTAKEMTATVRITLYGVKDGVVTRGEIRDYSVLTYAKNTLAKDVAHGLKTLLVDMLNYGAQAQEYFGFHEEFLANSTLTAQEQALATVAEPDIRSYMVQDDPTIPGSGSYGLSVLGASLSLKDKVELNFYLAPVTDTVEDKTMVIVYTDDKGEEITAEIEARDFVADSSGRYKATFSELTAKDMRTVVTCYLVDGDGVRVSNAMTYSIESYAASKIGNDTLRPLLTAMMKYGDSAESFFRPRNED